MFFNALLHVKLRSQPALRLSCLCKVKQLAWPLSIQSQSRRCLDFVLTSTRSTRWHRRWKRPPTMRRWCGSCRTFGRSSTMRSLEGRCVCVESVGAGTQAWTCVDMCVPYNSTMNTQQNQVLLCFSFSFANKKHGVCTAPQAPPMTITLALCASVWHQSCFQTSSPSFQWCSLQAFAYISKKSNISRKQRSVDATQSWTVVECVHQSTC